MSSATARVRTIAKKELVEFVRDWRTIVAILVIPLLMFPILFILFPLLLASEAAELDAVAVDVVVQGENIPEDLVGLLENSSIAILRAVASPRRTVDANRRPRTAKKRFG